MSLPAVLTAAETLGAAVPGVVATQAGAPIPDTPWSETPLLVLEWDGTWAERWITYTMMELRYGLSLTLVLGGENKAPADALAEGAVFKDRLRAAFSADPSLGGVCFQALLQTGAHNLLTYHTAEPSEPPQLRWRLDVTEHVAASAVAQT